MLPGRCPQPDYAHVVDLSTNDPITVVDAHHDRSPAVPLGAHSYPATARLQGEVYYAQSHPHQRPVLRLRVANSDITLATALTTSCTGGHSGFLAGDKVDFRVIRAYKTNDRNTHDAFVCAIELRLLHAGLPTAEVSDVISTLPEDGTPPHQLYATDNKAIRAMAVSARPNSILEVVRGPLIDGTLCGREFKVAMDTMADVNIISASLYKSIRPQLERYGCHLEEFPLQVGPFSPSQPGEAVLGILHDVPFEIEGVVFFLQFTVLPCKQPILMGMPFHDRHVVAINFDENTYEISPVARARGQEPHGKFTISATTQKWLMGPNGKVLDSVMYVGPTDS